MVKSKLSSRSRYTALRQAKLSVARGHYVFSKSFNTSDLKDIVLDKELVINVELILAV